MRIIHRQTPQTSVFRSRRGLGLVELLISLAIVASLLTATAMALNSSIHAYASNQERATIMQQGRLAINRILTSVRVTREQAPESSTLAAQFASGMTVTGDAIGMIDEHGGILVYKYDPSRRCILAVINGTPHVLARGVDSFAITMEPMRSPESIKTGGAYDLLRRASIRMTIRTDGRTAQRIETTGNQTLTLSAAVSPRQNSW